jgi:hypothetical protein
MPLKSAAAPDEGPVPEDSSIYFSAWLQADFLPEWLERKPPRVRQLHEPAARAVVVAGEIVRLVLLKECPFVRVRELYDWLVKLRGAAGPVVSYSTPELIEVRAARGQRGLVLFMGGQHHHAHAAVLAYPKRVDAEIRLASGDPEKADWPRVVCGLQARFVSLPDPCRVYRVLRAAEREAMGWGPPPSAQIVLPGAARATPFGTAAEGSEGLPRWSHGDEAIAFSEAETSILRALAKGGGAPLTGQEIANATGLGFDYVRQLLGLRRQLRLRRLVDHGPEGYFLTEIGSYWLRGGAAQE